MRKWTALLVALLLLLGLMPAAAQDAPPAELARYFPGKTALFATFRTDPGYLDALDAQLARLPLASMIPEGSPRTIRDMLNQSLTEAGTTLDEVLAWLGDYAAFGFWQKPGESPDSLTDHWQIVAKVSDRAAAEAYLMKLARGALSRETVGEFTRFTSTDGEGVIEISDELLLIYPTLNGGQPSAADMDPTLDRAPSFQSAVGALPAASYNILLYLTPSVIPADDPQAEMLFKNAGPLAVGLTILDDSVLVVDSAQLPGAAGDPAPSTAVNLKFAQYIPSSASAVIQGRDLTNLFNNLINLATISSPSDSNTPDPTEELSAGLRMAGLDLQKDFLDWMTGDFVLFSRINTLPVLNSLMENNPELTGNLDFGLVIEAVDPVAARGLATKLDVLLNQLVLGSKPEGIAIGDDTIGGTPVTLIQIDAPTATGQGLSLELVLGASDRVFFIATRSAAQAFLTGDGILSSDATYMAAQQYFLPQPATVLYTSGEGFVGTVGGFGLVGIFAMVGPAVGAVFDEIVTELDGSTPPSTPVPENSLQVFGQEMTPERVSALVTDLIAAVNHSSITSTVTVDGVTQVRLALQLQGE